MTQPHNLIYNYGRPEFKLPYRSNDDTPLSLPLAPKNVHVTSPYLIGIIDIRWDIPSLYAENNGLNVTGVNIYKAYDSPEETYVKLNTTPVGALYYRDQTTENFVAQEDPMDGGRIIMGTNATGDWVAKTFYKPIVIPGSNGHIANNYTHVKVEIKETAASPYVIVPAWKVVGETGEVFLIKNPVYNHTTNQVDPPILPDPSQGGEIRISYTYINNHIQTDINRKIYYKVTTVAVDPDSGDTIETPLAQCDAISLYDMEKIDWIWAEAIRRNKWILEQGGERVKVFIRKWAGEKCPCWDEEYKTSKGDCHVCFPEGTKVSMKDGHAKAIENIQAGEEVLTVDGISSKVLRTMNRDYQDYLYSISCLGRLPFTCTEDHPFYVLKKEDSSCVKYAKKYNKNKCSPMQRKICYRDSEPCTHKLVPKWVSAKELKEGDYLLTPKIKGFYKTFTEDEMFLFGVYSAEGSISWNGSKTKFNRIRFSLGEHEIEFISKIEDTFNRCYKKELLRTKSKGRKVLELYCHDDDIATSFLENCGRGSHNKRLSLAIMKSDADSIKSFMSGYFSGDGFLTPRKGYSFSTVSESLAFQIDLLLDKIGIPCMMGKRSQKHSTFGGDNIFKGEFRSFYNDQFKVVSKQSNSVVKKHQKKSLDIGDFIAYPIKDIRKRKASCTVYNLEVGRNSTYLVNNIVVHNCYGTGYVHGFEGPFEIIIAPPEAEKTVELQDTGLHVNYDFNTWTGPYPLLNDRDFVVRQNNNRFTVAHVNPQGSRGAIYQQHFMLAPLDHHDIRYQVPISGGALMTPESWNAYRESRPVDASPVIPHKPEIPDQFEYTGRTVTFENIVY